MISVFCTYASVCRTRARATNACARHEHDRRHPEREQLAEIRVADPCQPGAGDEDPGAERDHVQDTPGVVDRRVIRLLLVAVVQAVGAGEQHPDRQRRHKDQRFREKADPIQRDRVVDDEDLADHERGRQTGDVGRGKRPPDEPAALAAAHLLRPLPPRSALWLEEVQSIAGTGTSRCGASDSGSTVSVGVAKSSSTVSDAGSHRRPDDLVVALGLGGLD